MRSSNNTTAVRQHMSEIVKVKNGRDVDYLFYLVSTKEISLLKNKSYFNLLRVKTILQ